VSFLELELPEAKVTPQRLKGLINYSIIILTLITSLNKTTDAELKGIFPFLSLHRLINMA